MKQIEIDKIARAKNDFSYFVREVFSKSESLFPNGFVDGDMILEVSDFLQDNKKTARVSARDHFKSTSLYAHFMWKVLNSYGKNLEGHYFSYQQTMAGYHIAKIKAAIKSNPYFNSITDKKKTAESVIKFTWDDEHYITLVPHGLLEFKRGIHAPLIYVDDPFQDPSNKMILTVIDKINDIFKTQILDMVQDEIHVCGTPQTNQDFFFDKNIMERFAVMIRPAITDEKNKQVLWPEWMSWEDLMAKKREKGEKMFNQEYLCKPTYAEEAFIDRTRLYELVNPKLENLLYSKDYEIDEEVVGGFDIGKKAHPSHLAIFKINEDGKKIQIHQKFMDGWPYTRQISYLKTVIECLKVDALYYDNTRGEFESFEEQGELPACMKPVVFTLKTKHSMSAQLDKAITNGEVEFLNDERMLSQMLMVTNDLVAIETPQGHADSFWSVSLVFKHEEVAQPSITIIE
jgi:hypothetical protein